MILWTIQTLEAWNKLDTTEVLTASSKYIDVDFIVSYQWLINQMEKRIGAKPKHNIFPIWAWYQWRNSVQKRPDLRYRGHLAKGEKGVCIEFEIADKFVVLSDFDLWHYVLNSWYLPSSLEDDERFNKRTTEKGSSQNHEEVATSWQRIFDLDWCEKDIAEPFAEKSIQATFWKLCKKDIRKATFFTAR